LQLDNWLALPPIESPPPTTQTVIPTAATPPFLAPVVWARGRGVEESAQDRAMASTWQRRTNLELGGDDGAFLACNP
jgi:hypothetical protein